MPQNVTPESVREFILTKYSAQITLVGADAEVADDFDLLATGVIDSVGVLELIMAVELHFDVQLDLAQLPIEDLTRVGALSRFIAHQHPSGV